MGRFQEMQQQAQDQIQVHQEEQNVQAEPAQLQEQQQEQQAENAMQQPQVQEHAQAAAMQQQEQQQHMSKKEQRRAKRARKKADKQHRKELAQAEKAVEKAVADMKGHMQMQLTEQQARENPELAQKIAEYRMWYESSAGTAPLTPEVDALQMMVLTYLNENVGMPLLEDLFHLSDRAAEMDLLRQETFFRSMFAEAYFERNRKRPPKRLKEYLDGYSMRSYERIQPVQTELLRKIDVVGEHMTEEEKEEAARNHHAMTHEERDRYLRDINASRGRAPTEFAARRLYAERWFRYHGR